MNMVLYCWRKPQHLGKTPWIHTDNTLTPNRKAHWDLNWWPSCYEAAMLMVVPPNSLLPRCILHIPFFSLKRTCRGKSTSMIPNLFHWFLEASPPSLYSIQMSSQWPFTSDLRLLIMVVATNDEEEKKRPFSCMGTFLASIRKQSAFAKWKQAFIQEHKKSDQRQERKQHNMINTTTSQPPDPWEIFENTIKHWEQTNMSIKAWSLWNVEKIRILAVVKMSFVTSHWRQNRRGVFINVLWFYWITPVLFLAKVLLC